MHPSIGFASAPGCNRTSLRDCAPSYDTLAAASKLWPCPDGTDETGSCGGGRRRCQQGDGTENPVCSNLSAANPCCCPANGC